MNFRFSSSLNSETLNLLYYISDFHFSVDYTQPNS